MARTCTRLAVYSVGFLLCASTALRAGDDRRQEDKERRDKLTLSMRISPAISFSPATVSAVAQLKGDADPEQEAKIYCAAVEWDWGDGTQSEANADCEPYEEGKSEIKRRYSAQHTYNYAGRYRVLLRLKRNGRVILAANSNIQVRPGAREWGDH